MTESLYARLDDVLTRHAGRDCLRIPGRPAWKYRDMTRLAASMSGALAAAGVGRGDRVLVQVPKTPETVALYLATLRLGAIYVPINSAYTDAEVAYFIGDAEPRLFVSTPDRQPPAPVAGHLTLDAEGQGTLRAAAAAAEPAPAVTSAPEDLAAIVYTSGTTGRSKGAMLTHANLLSNAQTLIELWGWRDDDVLLHALPIFHVHGLFVAMHCALLTGTPMIWLPGFSTEAVLAAVPDATVMMGVPTFYTRLLAAPEFTAQLCAGMRLFISGSAPLTEQTFDAFEARTGYRILERYGMSETIMITSNPLEGERRAGTVGYPLPGVAVRIVAESGDTLPAGEVGVIEVKGPNVFAGYWRMPEKTRSEFRDDGYFITGDLGIMSGDGRVSIVGREKDLVISGGYNVYPKEIERLLDDLPGVLESAVIGIPHPDFGEGVVAVLVPAETGEPPPSEPTVQRVLGETLARFKLPKRVCYVNALPRNAMGKVQKNELRTQFANLFNG